MAENGLGWSRLITYKTFIGLSATCSNAISSCSCNQSTLNNCLECSIKEDTRMSKGIQIDHCELLLPTVHLFDAVVIYYLYMMRVSLVLLAINILVIKLILLLYIVVSSLNGGTRQVNCNYINRQNYIWITLPQLLIICDLFLHLLILLFI